MLLAKVISNLCTPGSAIGVVEVIRHEWFKGEISSWYYIDMEYCPETLDDWLHPATCGSRNMNPENSPTHFVQMIEIVVIESWQEIVSRSLRKMHYVSTNYHPLQATWPKMLQLRTKNL